MGKYLKKSKIAGDVSAKDISHPTTLGFRTRAAKNIRSHSNSPSDESDSFRYLQLRSRRLLKLPLLSDTRKQPKQQQLIHSVDECQTRNIRVNSVPAKKYEEETTVLVAETEDDSGNNEGKSESDCNFEGNGFGFESVNRETTPCNLRRDSKATQQSVVPSSREIEDFFEFAEKQQQRFFMEKYNFDIVTENPLQGRYKWVKVMP